MSGGKPHMFNGVPNVRLGVNIVFFDNPDNLPLLGLSSLLDEVLKWNKDMEEEALQLVFNFAERHLQD